MGLSSIRVGGFEWVNEFGLTLPPLGNMQKIGKTPFGLSTKHEILNIIYNLHMILFLCVYHQIYPLQLIARATLSHKITTEGFIIKIKKKKKKP